MDTVERVSVDPVEVVYDAFISYSHAADDLLAPRLQSALHRFAKPWWKRRAVRIFRDESSLSANPHLWSSITEALDTSGWFVLLLSPDAARSEWVEQEITYWVEHRDPKKILPVVTDGEFGWADGDVTGDAAPDALRGVFPEEPRWVDLRGVDTETELDLKHPAFAAAVADIASTIRGIPKDDLASEEVKQHRRTVRTAWAAGAGLLGLTVASTFFAVQAVQSADAAEAAREAETTNRLASQAPIVFQTDAQLGLLLAVEAFDREQTPVTLGALQRVLVGSRGSLGYVGDDVEYRDLAWIDDERFLASHHLGVDLLHVDGSVTNLGFASGAWLVELSPNRGVAAVSTASTVTLIDAATGDPTGVALPHPEVQSIAFSADGSTVATGDLEGFVYFWEVATGLQLGEAIEAHPESTFEEFGLRTEDVEGIVAHQTDTFRIGAVELSFSSDGRRLVTAGMVVARAWDVDTREMVGEARLEQLGEGDSQPMSALELRQTTASEPVTIATNGQLMEWMPGSGHAPNLIRSFDGVSGAGMTLALTAAAITNEVVLFAPDGGRLVGGDLIEGGSQWVLDSLLGGQAHIAVSPSGDRVAHSGDGGVAIWSLKGDGPISASVPNVGGDEVIASTDGRVLVNSLDQPSRLFRLGPSGLVPFAVPEASSWEWMWVIEDQFLGEEDLGSLEGPWRLDPETLEPLFQLALSEGNSPYAIDGLVTGLTVIGGISHRVDVSGADGSLLAVLEGLGAPVGSVDVSPDGTRVVAADVLGAAQVWDLATQRPVGSTPLSAGGGQVVVVEYHPSGQHLVTISQEGTVVLRDAETLQPTATLEGIGGIAAGAGSFGPFFQPDGRYMVTTADGLGRLWDLEELVQVGGTFPNDPGTLAQASSDGRWLVTVTDGDLVLWDLETSLWAERACRAAGRNLTLDEWTQFLGEETPYRAACPMWESDASEQEGGS